MFLGLDIGTSGVKAILVDERDRALGEASSAQLTVERPQPLWSEQDPEKWWTAVETVLDRLAADRPTEMGQVEAIGLSGQMLGVTLLDAADRPLRPALLWNDGRAAAEGAALESEIPCFAKLVGCRPMAGFPAPKLRWLARHEPARLAAARRILLTKDFVRLRLSGEAATDRADGSATLLMDTREGRWSPQILAACGIDERVLPRLVESGEAAGSLRAELARRWRLGRGIPIAGGAGDNMCGAVGAGVVRAGDAFISLGTSGVMFVVNDRFVPARGRGMHTHRHAVPERFGQHGVVLSAAAALDWTAAMVGRNDIAAFLAEIEAAAIEPQETPLLTPYLAGERTPHDDAHATGTVSGLTFTTTPAHLGRAALEGVALALDDCREALVSDGAVIERLSLIGGGARSLLWAEIIASVLGSRLTLPPEAPLGPAFGAARLARQVVGGPLIAKRSGEPRVISPRPAWQEAYSRKRPLFRQLYAALRGPM
jgi:xylulokinase